MIRMKHNPYVSRRFYCLLEGEKRGWRAPFRIWLFYCNWALEKGGRKFLPEEKGRGNGTTTYSVKTLSIHRGHTKIKEKTLSD